MALTMAALWGLRQKPCIVLHSCGLWIVLWLSALRLYYCCLNSICNPETYPRTDPSFKTFERNDL